jgi:hypothetical protein
VGGRKLRRRQEASEEVESSGGCKHEALEVAGRSGGPPAIHLLHAIHVLPQVLLAISLDLLPAIELHLLPTIQLLPAIVVPGLPLSSRLIVLV